MEADVGLLSWKQMWLVVFPWSLRTSASVHSGGAEGLPDNCLTDVGGNEEWDTRAKTVALLEELIQQQNNQTGHKQLETETECVATKLPKRE